MLVTTLTWKRKTLKVSTQNRGLVKNQPLQFSLGTKFKLRAMNVVQLSSPRMRKGKNTGTDRAGSRKAPETAREHVG